MDRIIRPWRRLGIPSAFALAASLTLLIAGTAQAASTVFDFEDVAPGSTVTTQYGPRGVLFNSHFLDTDAAAHSGTHVLRSVKPGTEIFVPVPIVMTFTSPQSRVKLFSESVGIPLNGTLMVFDAETGGNLIGQDGPKPVPADVFTTQFEVTLPTATIRRAEMHMETSAFHAIDDLEIEGEPPAPPPAQPPVVTVTSPANGSNLDVDTMDITGTVTGEGLISLASLTVIFPRPPGSTAPPFTSALSLIGTGTNRTFEVLGFTGVPMGPITVSVTAENSGALKGTGSSSFTNFPAAISTRLNAEGGTAAVGEFSFGIIRTDCKIAVFERAAIAVELPGSNTFIMRGAILDKWLSIRGLAGETGFFGCPTSEERAGPGGSRVQDFVGGRIYSNLPTGAVQVPAVFVNVIETREREAALVDTVPLADPVSPIEPFQTTTNTWLHQRFVRPDRPDLLPCTIEIRGNPPKLWVQRQSSEFEAGTAALWESFPCSGNLGPCDVTIGPGELDPIPDAGDVFCGGVAIADDKVGFILEGGRREWVPVLGDHVTTPIFGLVTKSHLASEDFRFTHQWFYNCPFETVRPDCPSDWCVFVEPIGPHRNVSPNGSLFAAGNPKDIEMEYERFYGEFVGWMGFPAPGDLIHAAGRWIIDCGHDTFRSELHPVFFYSKMKTVTEIIDPFTGLPENDPFAGQPATRADVWVNGWWPGDKIEFDIFPPPRPTPTARLRVFKPVDRDALIGNVTIEYSIEPTEAQSHVHIEFTAPTRLCPITRGGEMIWQTNRGYEGQWYVFWTP